MKTRRRAPRVVVDKTARAERWRAMIDGEQIKTRADLARYLGVSRARVTQVLGASGGAILRTKKLGRTPRHSAAHPSQRDGGLPHARGCVSAV